MKCVVCKHGETREGTATVTLERGNLTPVVKNVPAQVCENCGEEYIDDEASASLMETAAEAEVKGTLFNVREYRAA
jgi:YgiT-type zinc finger domain-containing protein